MSLVRPFAMAAMVAGTIATVPIAAQLPRPTKDFTLDVRTFPLPFGGYNQASRDHIAFSKDGALLATAAEANIVVWDVESRNVVTRMQLNAKQYAIHLAFLDDSKSLVSTSTDDPMIRFWDAKTGRQKSEQPHANAKEFTPPRNLGKGKEERNYRNPFLAFGPGAKAMAVLDRSSYLEIVDTATGKLLLKPDKVHAGWRGDFTFSDDGRFFATGGSHQLTMSVWDAKTGELVRTMGHAKQKTYSGYTYIRSSHDGKYLMGYSGGTGANDHYVAIWGVHDGLEYCRVPVWASSGLISPDGRTFLAGSGGRFFLFDLFADKLIDNVKLPAPNFYHAQHSPDGKTVALLGNTPNGNQEFAVYLTSFPVLGDDAAPKERLTAEDEKDLWTGLASANLFRRRYVTKIFKAHADQAVTLVEAKVKPAGKKDRERVIDLIKALDDDDFEVRDAAVKELRGDAFRFEPLLLATARAAPAGEVRNRVTFVLNEIADQPTPAELLSDIRGIELLETLGTSPARKLLEAIAGGALGARITVEAEQALKRLAKG